MGMFGAGIRNPYAISIQPYPDAPAMPQPFNFGPQVGATQEPVAPAPATYQARKPSFLDKLGFVADAFQGTNDNRAMFERQQANDFDQWQVEEAARQRQAAAAAQQNAPRFFQNDVGDYVRYDPASGEAKVVYDGPAKTPTPTALEQQIKLYRALNPKATDAEVAEIVKRGIAGAQYDPSVYRPMVDYRAAAAQATKAAPSYANTHRAPPRPRAAPKPPAGFILD